MATIINNQANISYLYNSSTGNATSNIVETTVLDLYGITASKTALQQTFKPGENITYITTIENNGSGNLYNILLQDDLGNNNLALTNNMIYLYKNEILTPITVTTPFSTEIPGVLEPGEQILIIYTATVNIDINPTINEIINIQTITARGGGATGPLITVTPDPTATITKADYAQLSIIKTADKETIMSGDSLTYTFTLINDGNIDAEEVVLTDYLPQGFIINNITSETNGITTVYNATEYIYDPTTRLLTLPNDTGANITVPASTNEGPGITTITIVGTVSL